MSRLRSADEASFWVGAYEPHSRDLHGDTVESWAANERHERADASGHGITESELRRIVTTQEYPPFRILAA